LTRQYIRQSVVRSSDAYDDTKTPAEIASSETAAVDSQEFLKYLLSQVKQILGTTNWYDAVPIDLATIAALNTFQGNCTSSEIVGNVVYVSGTGSSARYRVRVVDPTDVTKARGVGIIVAKASTNVCTVQWTGETAIYSGLQPGKAYFAGLDGNPATGTLPASAMWRQWVGTALDTDKLLIQMNQEIVGWVP